METFNFAYILASLIGGAMVYRMIISLVLHFGLSTDDMKLFTAIIVALALGIPALKSKIFTPQDTSIERGAKLC